MPIEITLRHMDGSPAVQAYAERKALDIIEEFPDIEHVHVILDVEKRSHVAGVLIQGRNHVHEEVSAKSENLRTAIDEATNKAMRRLRRLHKRMRDHKTVMKKAATLREPKREGDE